VGGGIGNKAGTDTAVKTMLRYLAGGAGNLASGLGAAVAGVKEDDDLGEVEAGIVLGVERADLRR
jgi:hypothetical protein